MAVGGYVGVLDGVRVRLVLGDAERVAVAESDVEAEQLRVAEGDGAVVREGLGVAEPGREPDPEAETDMEAVPRAVCSSVLLMVWVWEREGVGEGVSLGVALGKDFVAVWDGVPVPVRDGVGVGVLVEVLVTEGREPVNECCLLREPLGDTLAVRDLERRLEREDVQVTEGVRVGGEAERAWVRLTVGLQLRGVVVGVAVVPVGEELGEGVKLGDHRRVWEGETERLGVAVAEALPLGGDQVGEGEAGLAVAVGVAVGLAVDRVQEADKVRVGGVWLRLRDVVAVMVLSDTDAGDRVGGDGVRERDAVLGVGVQPLQV